MQLSPWRPGCLRNGHVVVGAIRTVASGRPRLASGHASMNVAVILRPDCRGLTVVIAGLGGSGGLVGLESVGMVGGSGVGLEDRR